MDSIIDREVARAETLLGSVATFELLREVVLAAARVVARADGATFVMRDGDRCFYVDEDAIAPLWKGQRFPIDDCLSGWAMIHDDVAIVPDIRADERVPQDAYRPTFVRSMVLVPIGRGAPVGAIGVYWATVGQTPDDDALAALLRLADAAAAAIGRLDISAAPWAPNFALERS